MVIKVGRTLTRYDMSFVCLVLMLLSMNCMISYGIIAKGIVWVIFRFVTFGERAERVVWKICGTSRIHYGFTVLWWHSYLPDVHISVLVRDSSRGASSLGHLLCVYLSHPRHLSQIRIMIESGFNTSAVVLARHFELWWLRLWRAYRGFTCVQI